MLSNLSSQKNYKLIWPDCAIYFLSKNVHLYDNQHINRLNKFWSFIFLVKNLLKYINFNLYYIQCL